MRYSRLCFAVLFTICAWGFTSAATMADALPFQKGISYVPVSPAESSNVKPEQIEVIEFFWYGCPHCYAFDPYVENWLQHKPANVVFTRIPVAMDWGEHMDIDGRAFYTAQTLGLEPGIHVPLFNAIHQDKQYALVNDQTALQTFFAGYGVSKKKFDDAWKSFTVQLKMNQALSIEQHYGLESVPTVIVDGRWKTGAEYKINDHYMAPADLIKCVEMLVRKAEALRKH